MTLLSSSYPHYPLLYHLPLNITPIFIPSETLPLPCPRFKPAVKHAECDQAEAWESALSALVRDRFVSEADEQVPLQAGGVLSNLSDLRRTF